MTRRHTDQDVAALYCAIRDSVCAVRAVTWRQRLLDFMFPEYAARRRDDAIALVYARWQAEREVKPTHDEPLAVKMDASTILALQMVKGALKKKADEATL